MGNAKGLSAASRPALCSECFQGSSRSNFGCSFPRLWDCCDVLCNFQTSRRLQEPKESRVSNQRKNWKRVQNLPIDRNIVLVFLISWRTLDLLFTARGSLWISALSQRNKQPAGAGVCWHTICSNYLSVVFEKSVYEF